MEDPDAYTKPWVSSTNLDTRLPKDEHVMEELPCVAEDEKAFTQGIREPAGANTPGP